MTKNNSSIDVENNVFENKTQTQNSNSKLISCPVYWIAGEVLLEKIIELPFIDAKCVIWPCPICDNWHCQLIVKSEQLPTTNYLSVLNRSWKD